MAQDKCGKTKHIKHVGTFSIFFSDQIKFTPNQQSNRDYLIYFFVEIFFSMQERCERSKST